MVQPDRLGVRAQDARGRLDQGPAEQGRSGRGWTEHGTVRGEGRSLSVRARDDAARRDLPTAGCQTGASPRVTGRRGRWGYPRSRIASSNRRSASCSNRSSMRRSAREVTASVPFFVCLRAILFAPSRRGRGCHDALREVDLLIKEGFTHVVDGHPSQQARADVLVDSAQPPPRACCDGPGPIWPATSTRSRRIV